MSGWLSINGPVKHVQMIIRYVSKKTNKQFLLSIYTYCVPLPKQEVQYLVFWGINASIIIHVGNIFLPM